MRFSVYATAALLLTGMIAAPIRAGDPAGTAPASSVPAAGSAAPEELPKEVILVHAQYFFRDGTHHFKVSGQAPYPDGVALGVALYLRRQPSTCASQALVNGGRFTAELQTSQRILPGYYEIRASFSPYLQYNAAAEKVANLPAKDGAFFLRIGTDEEILQLRRQLLDFYAAQLARFRESYERIRTVYVRIVKDKQFSRDRAQETWDRDSHQTLEAVQKDIEAYRAEFADCVIPMFPQLHGQVDAGFLRLFAATGELELALVSDLAEASAASGKNVTREDVLARVDALMQDLFRMLETQMLLEQEEQLRDLLLNHLQEMQWLFLVSSRAYGELSASGSEASPESLAAWRVSLESWKGNIESLRKGLEAYRGSRLAEKNPQALAELRSLPGMLRDLWALEDRAAGAPSSTLEADIATRSTRIDVLIRRLIEMFDFGNDLAEAARAGYSPLSGRGTAESQEREQKRIEDLWKGVEVEKPEARAKAIRILASYGDSIAKRVEAGFQGGGGQIQEACLFILGLRGDERAFEKLLPKLEGEKDPSMRSLAVDALGVIGKREALAPLAKLLKRDKEAAVRAAAAASIGNLHLRDGVNPLLDGLADADPLVRTRAWEAIGLVASVPPELAFTGDATPETRQVQLDRLRAWWAAAPTK